MPIIFEQYIEINASPETVWEVLTKPEFTRQYMFGCDAISDWKEGSPLIWKGAKDGKVYVKGSIVKIVPGKLLGFTSFDPNDPTHKDIPSNYTTVTYTLTPEDGKTMATVTDGDFSKIEDGETRYNRTIESWNYVLPQIKRLAERQP